MSIESVIIVNSDEQRSRLLVQMLDTAGREAAVTDSIARAYELLASELYDALFLDASLLGVPGMRTAGDIRAIAPHLPVVLTATESSPAVFAAMIKLCADELLTEPFANEQLVALLDRLDERERLLDENHYLWDELARIYGYDDLVGTDPGMAEVLRQATRVAQTDAAVLVQGEKGTEKELVAQYIHRASDNSSGPFIRLNCSGISPDLCARELFGYEDAHGKQPGRVELAAGGTRYLEDITALPLQMQARLVALLEDHLYLREGGYRYIPGRARVIAAVIAGGSHRIAPHATLDLVVRSRSFRMRT